MKFVFLTSGRFHVFDQVRELIKLGHEVKLYTLVPSWKAKKFGVPPSVVVWLAPRMIIKFIIFLLLKKVRQEHKAHRMINIALDKKMAQLMPDCDVFIGMSGMSLKAMEVARKKGIMTILQRSSRHIESQAEILRGYPEGEQVDSWSIKRELAEYEEADNILLLSKHSEESFLERDYPQDKLIRIMPGVDLSIFSPMSVAKYPQPTIIFVGNWGWRKGCDLLVEAWQELRKTKWKTLVLLHVGSQVDLEYPDMAGFKHVDRVNQEELPKFYNMAQVFCLPSREEGFAVVIMQALASGLRVVCSDHSGGGDLRDMSGINIYVCQAENLSELIQALDKSLQSALEESERTDFLVDNRAAFSWKAHAQSLVKILHDQR